MRAEEARVTRKMRREALEQVVAKMTPAQKATMSLSEIIAIARTALAGGIDYDVDYDENGNPSNAHPYLRVSPGAVFEKSRSAVARTVVAVGSLGASRPRARESAPRVARSSRRTATAARGSPRLSADDGDPDPPGLTALQRASARFGEALAIAASDSRTFETFIDIATIRVASENARRWAA